MARAVWTRSVGIGHSGVAGCARVVAAAAAGGAGVLAARATPLATAGATFLLNTLGMMYSAPSSPRLTQDGDGVRRRDLHLVVDHRGPAQSSSPRKNPGKQSTLLIWFG